MSLRLLGTQAISNSEITIGQIPVSELRARFGTPLYVVDEVDFRGRIRRMLKAARAEYDNVALMFASKSNGCLAILQIAREEGMGVDVASEGEWGGAMRAGFLPDQVHFHGNYKSSAELALAPKAGAFMVDSFEEIAALEAQAQPVKVILRLAPNVDPITHEAIRTGQADTKFGFNISDGSAERAVNTIKNSPYLTLIGLHSHVGSQLLDSEAVAEGARFVGSFARSLNLTDLEEVSVGGGLGIAYLPETKVETIEEFMPRVIRAALDGLGPDIRPRLSFEPGRSLIGEVGSTLYTAGPRKEVPLPNGQTRRYLSIDGGLADNPRPQLYSAVYHALNASRPSEPADTEFTLASRHCEQDTVIRSVYLPANTQQGDLILVQCTGAYGYSMSSNYNRYPRPAVVLVSRGEAFQAVARETLDHLFAFESIRA